MYNKGCVFDKMTCFFTVSLYILLNPTPCSYLQSSESIKRDRPKVASYFILRPEICNVESHAYAIFCPSEFSVIFTIFFG